MATPTNLTRERSARQLAQLDENAATGWLPLQPQYELAACPACLAVYHSPNVHARIVTCNAHGLRSPVTCLPLTSLRIKLARDVAEGGAR